MTEEAKCNQMDKNKQIVESRSNIIQQTLIYFQKKCKNPEKLNEVQLEEILGFLEYMSIHLAGDESCRFEDSFIGYLKLIVMKAKDPPDEFCKYFGELTQLLCDVCLKIDKKVTFSDRLLRQWLEILNWVPKEQRYTTYLRMEKSFKKFGKLLAEASSASLQYKLLDILHAYFEGDEKNSSQWMSVVFQNVSFLAKDLFDYVNIDFSSFAKKQMFIYWLNQRLEQPTIHMELAVNVKIGNQIITFENDVGFICLNEIAKTIEFWIQFKGENLKVTIRAMNVKKVQIIDNDLPYAMGMVFILNSEPRIETTDGKRIGSSRLADNVIKVNFDCGFLTTKLQPLLIKMFNKEAEILSEDNANDSREDFDIAIISVRENENFEESDYETDETDENDNLLLKDVPTTSKAVMKTTKKGKSENQSLKEVNTVDPFDSVKESSPVAKKKLPKSTLKRSKEPSKVGKAIIDLTDNEMDQSPKKKTLKADTEIVSVHKNENFHESVHEIDENIDLSLKDVPTTSKAGMKTTKEEKSKNKSSKEVNIVDPFDLNTLKRSKEPSKVGKAIIDLTVNEMDQSPKKKILKSDQEIPTSSFYSKTKSSRPKRQAAQKAVKNIKGMTDDVYDLSFDEEDLPPKKGRTTLKPKRETTKITTVPEMVVRRPFKRGEPKKMRKLFNNANTVEVDVPEEEPMKYSVFGIGELTSESFKSSFNAERKQQHQRVIDNLSKINEIAATKRVNPNVSFSYRQSARKNKQPPPDSTMMSDESKDNIEHFDGSNGENIDANANVKKCQRCFEKTLEDLKTISRLSNNVLAQLNPNSSKCLCGASTRPESS